MRLDDFDYKLPQELIALLQPFLDQPMLLMFIIMLIVIAVGYALFLTANNTAVMADVTPDQRGVVSGMLNLSRNLGLITGASVMGAVFALASATIDITTARPEAVATGMRTTFATAAVLIIVTLVIAVRNRALAKWQPAVGGAS